MVRGVCLVRNVPDGTHRRTRRLLTDRFVNNDLSVVDCMISDACLPKIAIFKSVLCSETIRRWESGLACTYVTVSLYVFCFKSKFK